MIVGLDFSLRSTGCCALPDNWVVGDWSSARFRTVKKERKSQTAVGRAAHIIEVFAEVAAFISQARQGPAPGDVPTAVDVWIETYAFSMTSSSVTGLAELGGYARAMLVGSLGVTLHDDVPGTSARKLLLGKLSKAQSKSAVAKALVLSTLQLAGAPVKTTDEADAFAIANWGLAKLGKVAMMTGEQE